MDTGHIFNKTNPNNDLSDFKGTGNDTRPDKRRDLGGKGDQRELEGENKSDREYTGVIFENKTCNPIFIVTHTHEKSLEAINFWKNKVKLKQVQPKPKYRRNSKKGDNLKEAKL